MELFKEIPQYEGIYILSSNGYVKNIKTNRILKNKKATVFSISLKKGGSGKTFILGRLVYSSFKNVKLQRNHLIIHKDGNPLNCRLSNLKLITKRNFISAKMQNKLGITGVSKVDKYQYSAQITFSGKQFFLHASKNKGECHKIYQLAKAMFEEYDRKRTEIISNYASNRLINKSVSVINN